MISIIVPVYNVESYLRRCIDSILCQAEIEIEVILINDGSADGSGYICDEYVERDDRVKVIHKKNGGLSSARNAGLDIASGEYVLFVDSDDFIEDNALRVLNKAIECQRDVDIFGFGFRKINENGDEISREQNRYPIGTKCKSGEIMAQCTIVSNVWSYLFSRKLLEVNRLRFLFGVFHEDEEFTIKAFLYSEYVYFIRDELYNYLCRSKSIMNSVDMPTRMRKINDMLKITSELLKFKSNTSFDKLKWFGLNKKIDFLCVGILLHLSKKGFDRHFTNQVLCEMKSIGVYPLRKGAYSWKYSFLRMITKVPCLMNFFLLIKGHF